MNAFQTLSDNLKSGELNLRLVEIAVLDWIKSREDIPEGARNLLVTDNDNGNGMGGPIRSLFDAMRQIIGSIELAYRRGEQKEI